MRPAIPAGLAAAFATVAAAVAVACPLTPAGAATRHVSTPRRASASRQQAAPGAAPALKRIAYRGYTFTVPRSWPVIRVAADAGRCVRFDIHALYLGAPGSNQSCPSGLVGTTEAVLVQPGPARAARTATEDQTSQVITARAPRIAVTATFSSEPALVDAVLARAGLPAPQVVAPGLARPSQGSQRTVAHAWAQFAGPRRAAAAARRHRGRRAAPKPIETLTDLPPAVTAWHGLGFDSCAAPSSGYMRAWRRHSPYRAVGVYIGGADRACAQPNLTAGWVAAQARAGWRFIPLYVGPQAAYFQIRRPQRQGTSAAADAVAQAERLGLGNGTPLYYDMEAYPPRQTGRALRFLSAWTAELHRLGFTSGVYSSSRSGVEDLSRNYSRRGYVMPDAIFDALWNGRASTADPSYRPRYWREHQRLHQFSGNVRKTYGRATIDIDQDFLNVDLAWPGGTSQGTPAVTSGGGAVEVFYRGPGGHLWRARYTPGGGWSAPADMGGTLESAPSAVDAGHGVVDVFWRGPHGYLYFRTGSWKGGFGPIHALVMMGALGGPPRAVAQASGVVDVFWRGSADSHLWHGEYSPGHGWAGPQKLGGELAGNPAPVASSPGRVAVFWRGTSSTLWQVSRGLGGSWSRPQNLGMGPLGGSVLATAQSGGGIEVTWRGSSPHSVWAAYRSRSGHWTGPRNLGGNVTGAPWPATGAHTVWMLWHSGQGTQQGLWAVRRLPTGKFGTPLKLRSGAVGSSPFSAVGAPDGDLEVFWAGPSGQLYAATVGATGAVATHRLATHRLATHRLAGHRLAGRRGCGRRASRRLR